MSNIRQLGKLQVAPLGFGAMGCSEFYGEIDTNQAERVMHRYIELSGRNSMIDTADGYGFGDNERLVGKVIRQYDRQDLVIATKCGIVRDQHDPAARGVDTSPGYIEQACQKSLERLEVDCIDLYYLHRLDGVTPIEESLDSLIDLSKKGCIRYIGLSEVSIEIVKKTYAYLKITNNEHLLSAIQMEYSLWSRGVEKNGVLDLCQELNIGLVAYSPLGRGFLTGKMDSVDELDKNDFRRGLPRFNGENFQKNRRIVEQIQQISQSLNCSPAQLSLAWLLAKEQVVPIPGTKRENYLLENMKALDVLKTPQKIENLVQWR